MSDTARVREATSTLAPNSGDASETWRNTVKSPLARERLPTMFMMQGMREQLSPAEFGARALQAGFPRSLKKRWYLLQQAYDSLISGGFVSRSDVYLSVPNSSRQLVADTERTVGQYWTPGRREGLHKQLREQCPVVPPLDLEACVRYGPIESLYGDLFANLRRYELLLWGFLRGVLSHEFPGEAADWRRSGWWAEGVPQDERKTLTRLWAVRYDVERPWQLATFATMHKVVVRHGALFIRTTKGSEIDSKALAIEVDKVTHIRNAVMHPLAGKTLNAADFALVADALRSLVLRADAAKSRGNIDESCLPSQSALMLPEILREHLFPET